MNAEDTSEHPPIYDRLVRERGDVLAEAREVAAQMRAQAKEALDWSELRRAERGREERAFSAFGNRR
ncbi:hypothetical protein OHR86_25575 [Streptomyces sp. NBC_00441]|uniref:hypothetical protein n=1 Tax=Streptomyces sp. NBC_00441 TaxID=2975742 RepID=UPI002E2AC878|nr:hypothetical protein [Streptomyces sp. NBC_00441]